MDLSAIENKEANNAHVPSANKPLKVSGALGGFESFDVTPLIGQEFPKANIVEWLRAPNADELLRDLAITVSERGVVFFRAQDQLTPQMQKELIIKLGSLTCRPASSGLHIHPIFNADRDDSGDDHEISMISSKQRSHFIDSQFGLAPDALSPKKQSTSEWHSDVSFEPVPADYACLRLEQLPPTGGDTMWASGYELYDKISAPYQKFLETLTVTFEQRGFKMVADRAGFKLYDAPRGSPDNVGDDLRAVHPVVRTNPVTGWKSIFAIGGTVKHINGLTSEESQHIVTWFQDILQKNHDMQVRFKWMQPNDLAIWDNRSTYHSATFDYLELGDRFGTRACGVGERPYLDPNSKSRREDIAESARDR
ncbi:hypothetical protein FJTKL_03586 [Diaporthe vaccinii]|uniref:TauD/TfdA-like domain-containing protein n=1 Tax=Diaporthe vaccinii TaxID=105482 RepID=A0ABR4DV50_9PEZI